MENKNKMGTIVDGIFASEHLDSSGEVLDIKGMDISSLGSADSILNFEHNSKDNPSQVCGKVTFAKKIFKKSDCSNEREEYFWNICKKPFVYGKGELFDHPDLDHDGARNVAALLRYDNRDKGKKARRLISFSIEGGKMEKEGVVVKKSIARDVALTIKHCNKMCIAEILDDLKDRSELYKREVEAEIQFLAKNNVSINSDTYRDVLLQDVAKSVSLSERYKRSIDKMKESKSFKQKAAGSKAMANMATKPQTAKPQGAKPKRQFQPDKTPASMKIGDSIDHTSRPRAKTGKELYSDPSTFAKENTTKPQMKPQENIDYMGRQKARTGKDIYNDPNTWKSEKNNMRKTLIAGMMGGAPSSLTGTAALTGEDLMGSMEKVSKKKTKKVKKNEMPKNPHDIVEVHPSKFHSRIDKFRNMNDMNRANVHGYSPEDYSQMKTYMTRDGKSGYAIKNGNELVSVHSSERGRGDHLVSHAVKMGAKRLDAYDIGGKLPKLYSKHGFQETGRYSFDPQYADASNKMLHTHKPDFVEMSIPDKMKKGQPSLELTRMSGQSRPEQDTATIDNPYAAERFSKQRSKPLPSNFSDAQGVAVLDRKRNKATAYDMSPSQTREEMQRTKGKGNFPTTKQHEDLHTQLNRFELNHPSGDPETSKAHRHSLVRHMLSENFHPKDVASMSNYVKQKGYKGGSIMEEVLTHLSDLRTSPEKRKDFNRFHNLGEQENQERMSRIKSGWKKLIPSAKEIDYNKVSEIHNKLQEANKKPKEVKIQRVKPGESGLK